MPSGVGCLSVPSRTAEAPISCPPLKTEITRACKSTVITSLPSAGARLASQWYSPYLIGPSIGRMLFTTKSSSFASLADACCSRASPSACPAGPDAAFDGTVSFDSACAGALPPSSFASSTGIARSIAVTASIAASSPSPAPVAAWESSMVLARVAPPKTSSVAAVAPPIHLSIGFMKCGMRPEPATCQWGELPRPAERRAAASS